MSIEHRIERLEKQNSDLLNLVAILARPIANAQGHASNTIVVAEFSEGDFTAYESDRMHRTLTTEVQLDDAPAFPLRVVTYSCSRIRETNTLVIEVYDARYPLRFTEDTYVNTVEITKDGNTRCRLEAGPQHSDAVAAILRKSLVKPHMDVADLLAYYLEHR